MKTPVGVGPASWEPRRRLVAAGVAGLLVLGLGVWWATGGDDRRAASACDLYEDQKSELETVASEVDEAAGRALEADDSTVIGYFNDIDRELGSLRRWQSTSPRLEQALGEVGDGIDRDVEFALAELTGGAAEMQRLIESGSPRANLDWVPELGARLELADDTCAAA